MESPKLFISYSWSNPIHEQWVIELANELTESGIHVILDKWDLKEGHDSVAFMEKMVTDPQITKVAIVCDEVYASKADVVQIGEIKILQKGKGHTLLPPEFSNLEDEYISLGQSLEFYKNLYFQYEPFTILVTITRNPNAKLS